jgi:hypothetical protein
MDPSASPDTSAGPTLISPSFSPLHPSSVQHNLLILSNLCTLTSVFSGTLAGILGLLNFKGFILYFFSSLFTAGTIALLKCRNEKTGKVDLERFLPSLHGVNEKSTTGWKLTMKALWSLMDVGQENLLTFLLFWIGFYVSVIKGCLNIKALHLGIPYWANLQTVYYRLRRLSSMVRVPLMKRTETNHNL